MTPAVVNLDSGERTPRISGTAGATIPPGPDWRYKVQPQTALVIEDDADIRQLVTDILTGSGCEVHQAATGRDIEQLLQEHKPDLITLDLGLPGLDGLDVTRRIRATPTPRDHADRPRRGARQALRTPVGADDYLTKPFSSRELRARVTALFRRPRHMVGVSSNGASAGAGSPTLDAGGGLAISQDRREAKVGEQTLPLTRTEFDFLVLLASRPGQVWRPRRDRQGAVVVGVPRLDPPRRRARGQPAAQARQGEPGHGLDPQHRPRRRLPPPPARLYAHP